jgi:hypothetical protein
MGEQEIRQRLTFLIKSAKAFEEALSLSRRLRQALLKLAGTRTWMQPANPCLGKFERGIARTSKILRLFVRQGTIKPRFIDISACARRAALRWRRQTRISVASKAPR